MLSRVADSLYWMSRYFERATHCSRVLEANYSLMLNPGKLSTEQRWQNIMGHLGLEGEAVRIEPQAAIMKLMSDHELPSSIVSCVTSARENASQVREEISSEMWERLNQLYHEVVLTAANMHSDSDVMRLFMTLREGGYKFIGVTDASMNHGEGWHFIQLGKYIERTSSLLTSCSAFEAYCKVYTADLKAERVAEFLLLNPEFPYTARYSTEKMQHALEGIQRTAPGRKVAQIERIAGRIHASLAYAQIDDIMSRDFERFLGSIIDECQSLHSAVHEAYIDYPIESAFAA
jgi:uncharacterized alpha-E superfamily protein